MFSLRFLIVKCFILLFIIKGNCFEYEITEINVQEFKTLKSNLEETTVSGLSSGGFMAVQLHFAFSKYIKGAGILAAGPYYCAEGDSKLANGACMKQPDQIEINYLISKAKEYSDSKYIDDLSNISGSKVFLYSGTLDSVVLPGVVKKTEEFYNKLGSKVVTDFDVDSQHCYPTKDHGNKCNELKSPYICDCNIDMSFKILNYLYKDLKPGIAANEKSLRSFKQSLYFDKEVNFGLSENGYVYIPESCKKRDVSCPVHVSIHGCNQGFEVIGDSWIKELGYNEIAEANNLIILYPQVSRTSENPINPYGCWDWWGYSDPVDSKSVYATKAGKQMKSIWLMIYDLTFPDLAINISVSIITLLVTFLLIF